jgi:translocation and assembly module TamB
LAKQANAILSPGSVEFGAIHVSWFRPTEISRFVLRDAQGESVLASPHAVFEWSLSQMLFSRPASGRITIERGELDIERFADGRIDLYETLRPIIEEHPKWRRIIHIQNGRLRFRDPALADPVIADGADIDLNLGRGYEPITWKIALVHNRRNGASGELAIAGNQSREQVDSRGNPDVSVLVNGSRWPWSVAAAGVRSRGEFSGTIDARRRRGAWNVSGDADLPGLEAAVTALGAGTVRVEALRAAWKLAGDERAWRIDKLEVTSSLGDVRGHGSFPPSVQEGAWFEGSTDLARLSRQLPGAMRLREGLRLESGLARFRLDARVDQQAPAQRWSLRANVSDLVAAEGRRRLTIAEPATIDALISREGSRIALDRFEVQTPFLRASAKGDIDSGVDLEGTLDLAEFSARFRDFIDLGSVEPAGVCKLNAHYQRRGDGYEAKARGELGNVRLGGLPLLGTFERGLISLTSACEGGADAAGWPLDWRQWSLHATSADSGLEFKATNGRASGEIAIDGRGVAKLTLGGRPRRAEAEVKLSSDRGTWNAQHLALAIMSDSQWGPGMGPGGTLRWAGRGRFDPARDELVVESVTPNHEVARKPGAERAQAGWLKIRGLTAMGSGRIEAEASADLADFSTLVAPPGEAWGGRLDGRAHLRREGELWEYALRLELHDPAQLSATARALALDGTVSCRVNGLYSSRSDQLRVTELALEAPLVAIAGAGTVERLTDAAELDFKGSLSPDWGALSDLLARRVEPNAHVAGRPRSWNLSGKATAGTGTIALDGLRGECGIEIDELDVFGMQLGGAPLVLELEKGQVRINPIDSTLNGGTLHLEPELARREEGSIWLRLGPSTKLEGAVVNDEVSHRVLSYVAPVLDGATRVRGKVSLGIEEALVPLAAGEGASEKILGNMIFDDVRFMPGPLATELLGILLKEDRPLLVLRDPVSVHIANGKVYQKGLVIPLGKAAGIAVEGSVDFRKNLDMVASFGMFPRTGSGPAALGPLARSARIEIPIRGTLDKPKIDAGAFAQRLKSIGKDLLETSMEAGADTWQKLLESFSTLPFRGLFAPGGRAGRRAAPPGERSQARPGSQNPSGKAQSKATEERRNRREARKHQRLEKKAQRRLERDAPPEI